MSWSINPDDVQAIEILDSFGPKTLTDLVREIYGIETGQDGKEDNGDRLKKINRFKKHLKIMMKEGFLETETSKTERNQPITVYKIAEGIIRGRGILLILNDEGVDMTQIGRILKVSKGDGKTAILPLL